MQYKAKVQPTEMTMSFGAQIAVLSICPIGFALAMLYLAVP